jgi:hypothetical protein
MDLAKLFLLQNEYKLSSNVHGDRCSAVVTKFWFICPLVPYKIFLWWEKV